MYTQLRASVCISKSRDDLAVCRCACTAGASECTDCVAGKYAAEGVLRLLPIKGPVCVFLSPSLYLFLSLSLSLCVCVCMNIRILIEICIAYALLSHSHISEGCTGEYTDDDRDDTNKNTLPPMCTCVCIHLCMQQIYRCTCTYESSQDGFTACV